MLVFTLITNISQDKVTLEVLEKASQLLSGLLDTQVEDVIITIKASVQMAWGTKPGNFALSSLQNTRPFLSEDTKNYAPQIFEFIEQYLGIPQNRMYLGFVTLCSDNVAVDGKLYSTIKWE